MANFNGYEPAEMPRFCSFVEWDDPTKLPFGIAAVAKNVRYNAETVGSRWGQARAFNTGTGASTSGLKMLEYTGTGPLNMLVTYDQAGNVLVEEVEGSGVLVSLGNPANNSLLKAGCYSNMETAYGRTYLTQTADLITGLGYPMVVSGANKDLQKLSDKPLGFTWTANTQVVAGDIFSPTSATATLIYQAQNSGTTGANEPAWPLGDYSTVNDNGITWKECTPWMGTVLPTPAVPVIARDPGAGTFAAGRDVYILVTLLNQQGETDAITELSQLIINTALNDGVLVTAPTFPAALQQLAAQYQANAWNVYEADVATGSAAPGIGAFTQNNTWAIDTTANSGLVRAGNVVTVKLKTAHPFSGAGPNNVVGLTITISNATDGSFDGTYTITAVPDNLHLQFAQVGANTTSGLGNADVPLPITMASYVVGASTIAGASLAPTSTTAYITPPGNICTGQRWMSLLFENTNGYQDGITDAIPIGCYVPDNGRQLWVGKIPLGRANTISRLLSFTVAGDARAGRYWYIPANDQLYPNDVNNTTGGFLLVGTTSPVTPNITGTVIDDNVTTNITVNFPDFYLTDLQTEVTDYFDKAEVPPCVAIVHSKTFDRMVYIGAQNYPSGFLVSDSSDPETIRIPQSEVEVAENDGDRAVGWMEIGQTQFGLKWNSGHYINDTDPDPENWDAQGAWAGSGPCSSRAYDSTDKFGVYWHESGLYMVDSGGSPTLISPEIVATLKRINYKGAKSKIWVRIDQRQKEIHIGLPLDGATDCNYRLRLSVLEWSQLTQEPVVFSVRMHSFIPNAEARKWSLDQGDYLYGTTCKRNLQAPPQNAIADYQFINARTGGLISYEVPFQYHDNDINNNKVGFLSIWESVKVSHAGWVQGLGGGSVSAIGNGKLNCSGVGSKSVGLISSPRRIFNLTAKETVFDGETLGAYDEYWGMHFDNGAVIDAWFEIHQARLYTRPAWQTRPG